MSKKLYLKNRWLVGISK